MSDNPYDSSDVIDYNAPDRALKRRRPHSLPLIVIVVNFGLWHIGVWLNSFGGWRDELGAHLCLSTYTTAFALVPATFLYAFYRRVIAKADWDLYGPALAIISMLIIYWEMEHATRY